MDDIDLYCHEDEEDLLQMPLPQPETLPPQQERQHYYSSAGASSSGGGVQYWSECHETEDDDPKDILDDRVAWQNQLRVPTTGDYMKHLPQQTHFVRQVGVECVFHAFIILGLGGLGLEAAATAVLFSAVSYMDRFLSAISYDYDVRELNPAWMSVACLSLAYKQQGVNLPTLSLQRLQEVALETYRRHCSSLKLQGMTNLRKMEVDVFKVLDRHLTCHTSCSFLDVLLALTNTRPTAAAHCTRLLIDSLKDPSFFSFHTFVIAVSALKCVAIEDQSHDETTYFDYIRSLLRPEGRASAAMDNAALEECFTLMKALHQKTTKGPSPTSVLPDSNKRSTDDDTPPPTKRRLVDNL